MTKSEALDILAIARMQSIFKQQENAAKINEALKVALVECDEDQFSFVASGVFLSSTILHFVFHHKGT